MRLKQRLIGGKNEEDADGSIDRLRKDVSLMGQMLASVQESIKSLQDRVRNDLESIRISQNYQYAELSRDIEELREGALGNNQGEHFASTNQQDVMRSADGLKV